MDARARSIVQEIIGFVDRKHPTIICDDTTEPSPGVLRVVMFDTAVNDQEIEVEFRA